VIERRTDVGKVGTGFSTSLDGFIAGPHDGPGNPLGDGGERLFAWYFGGDTDYEMPSGGITLRVSPQSAELLRESHEKAGALVVGRRHFDLAGGWGGRHPIDVPVFVVTHSVPEEWVYEGSPFTFVTDGIESAVGRAKSVADGKDVGIGGANVAQQAIKAGLIDEIGIDLVPVLLGGGVRFFDNLINVPVELERTRAVEAPGVTRLRFRVVKEG
jgi:dihydrofolate reductase